MMFWSSLCKDVVDFNEECSGLAFGLQAGNHSHLRRQEDAENRWQWLGKERLEYQSSARTTLIHFRKTK